MPNPIKYTTGSETLALKKGNFYIGTGDVGKGPTDSTGYYNGISPATSGYTIYMYRSGAPGDLSYHSAANDGELISFTNNLAGQSYTSATQCLVYYAGQTDKVCLNIDYPAISTNGLVLNLDAGFTPSYPQSGTTWYDLSLSGSNCTLYNGPTYSGGSVVFDGADDYASLGNISYNRTNFSCFVWFNATSYYNNWRSGLLTKWTSTNAPSMSEWSIGFNASSGPSNFGAIVQKDLTTVGNYLLVTGGDNYVLNKWYNVGMTWNSGVLKLYIDGIMINSGSTNVTVPNTTTQPVMIASFGDGASYSSPVRISNAMIYNKTLSDTEVLQNYRVGYFKTQNIVTNGLILYLDAGVKVSYPTTGVTWYDMSGNNFNGTLTNGPTYSSDGGGSIVFDGTDDYISIVLPSPISVSSFSYNVWFNADSVTGAYRTIIDLNNDNFLITIVPEGTLAMWTPTYNTGYAVNIGQWYNIQVSHEYGQPYYWYVNGTLIYTYNASTTTSHTVCNIGVGAGFNSCIGRGPDEFFDGKIPVASMYNRGLSSTEVLQNYNAQKGRFGL